MPRMTPAFPPTHRPRRLRYQPWLRSLVAEHHLTPADFIWPVFLQPNQGVTPIPSMPGMEIVAGPEGRRATTVRDGAPVEIGSIEKMSKSKRNTVDPDEIIGTFGADAARWFMLSDSPPEGDVIWSEDGVQGVARFQQRVWRLVGELKNMFAGVETTEAPTSLSDKALAVRKATHLALAKVEDDIVRLRFNRCIAHANELVNRLGQAISEIESAEIAPDMAFACREAAESLVLLISPMMPHLAEECWADIGCAGLVSSATWKAADRALIVEDVLVLPVQVNGKKRAEVSVPRDADDKTVETLVLQDEQVQRALEGRAVKRFIVVRGRIVNVVV